MWVLSFETSIRPKIHWELFPVEEVEVVASRGRCGNGDETRLQGRRGLRVGTEWEIEKDAVIAVTSVTSVRVWGKSGKRTR